MVTISMALLMKWVPWSLTVVSEQLELNQNDFLSEFNCDYSRVGP